MRQTLLSDPYVPIDNSASERAIRTFCVGKKNWVIIDSTRGAQASAAIYSISETAKLNNLSTYNYFNHLLTELPKINDNDGNVTADAMESLLPWSKNLPDICHKPRRWTFSGVSLKIWRMVWRLQLFCYFVQFSWTLFSKYLCKMEGCFRLLYSSWYDCVSSCGL